MWNFFHLSGGKLNTVLSICFYDQSFRFKLYPCEIVMLELATGNNAETNCSCYYGKKSLELQVELLFLGGIKLLMFSPHVCIVEKEF